MLDSLNLFFLLPLTIGGITFLIQQTDFVYDYLNLLTDFIGKSKAKTFLKLEEYKISNLYENYLLHLAGTNQIQSGLTPFLFKLSVCPICLNCFLSLFSALFLYKVTIFMFYFLISITTYLTFFLIKRTITNQ